MFLYISATGCITGSTSHRMNINKLLAEEMLQSFSIRGADTMFEIKLSPGFYRGDRLLLRKQFK